jgi:hypothetical protein
MSMSSSRAAVERYQDMGLDEERGSDALGSRMMTC